MTREIFGRPFGDKGHISKALLNILTKTKIKLVTQVRRNLKKAALSNKVRTLLLKRAVIEAVNDQLNNISHTEYTKHRFTSGFLLNLMGAVATYSFGPTKPWLHKK